MINELNITANTDETQDRIILSKFSILLRALSAKGKKDSFEEFTILSTIGKGGSSVCYEASNENGEQGRLKEFYPFSENSRYKLKRNGSHQLVVENSPLWGEDAYTLFEKDCDELKATYKMLQETRNEFPALNNYMPNFEIYVGYDSERMRDGSVYVWTKNDKNIITFDNYLRAVADDIANGLKAEQHLLNILNSLLTLTKCIRSLNKKDIFHLDIKPENFGIAVDEREDVLSGNISLFDVNTIHQFGSNLPVRSAGTNGFSAKELREGEPNNKTDIYSIGATLFNAIMYSNGEDCALYDDMYYNYIERIISSSRLITASDATSDSKLYDCIIDILKNCLNVDSGKRYLGSAYDGLVSDLCKAIAILYPSASTQTDLNELGTTLKVSSRIVNIEEQLDSKIKTGATGAIQRLLLENPLYDYIGDRMSMNVLVLGAGTYAQKFIDISFEISQIKNCKLNITAVSNDINADKNRYLSARPGFIRFFSVDENVLPEEQAYGSLCFKSTGSESDPRRAFSKTNDLSDSLNEEIIKDILSENNGSSYIFIALGDDDLNRKIAQKCLNYIGLLNQRAFVSYVQYKGNEKKSKNKSKNALDDCMGAVPVFVNDVITESPEYVELRQMAFNCHILWDKTLSIDLKSAKKEFMSPYNYNSSFSNVLSIKYKLHSLGICLNNYTSEETIAAAVEFQKKINNQSVLNDLAMYEHRRWVCNNICKGWNVLRDYQGLTSDTKDKKAKLHPCLVRSKSEWALSKSEWTENNHKKWDEPLNQSNLDELDTMSVLLHQQFVKQAKAVNKSLFFYEINITREFIKEYQPALNDFNSLVSSLIEILDSTSKQTWLYRYYHRRFTKSIVNLPENLQKTVKEKLKVIDMYVYPILESKKYTDYKAIDQVLVKNIPFILTYSTEIHLCIPFGIESRGEINNRILFNNIATPIILNPSIITYIVDSDDFYDSPERFEKAIKYVYSTMDERGMQAKISLVFIQSTDSVFEPSYYGKVISLSNRIGDIEIIEYKDDNELNERLKNFITKYKNSRKSFTAFERNNTGISKLMRGFGCYQGLPSYTLDNSDKSFVTSNGCEYFNYVQFDEYLRVSEIFACQQIEGGTQPSELPDYEYFWQIYKTPNIKDSKTKNEQAWKVLCGILSQQADIDDCLARIEIPQKPEQEFPQKKLCVPAMCYASVKYILSRLVEISPFIVGKKPLVEYYTSQSCVISMNADDKTCRDFERLLSNPYLLNEPKKIRVEKRFKEGKAYAIIYFNNLMVGPISEKKLKAAFNGQEDRIIKILEQLNQDHKIVYYQLDESSRTYSFCYSSPQIKDVLTNEGKILELYVYYKALEENYFDDIVCSYVVNDENNVSNEFDLILTKGFKTIIVECKARAILEQEFYHKLAQLNQQYGVNSTAVLVADTLEKPWWNDTEVNSTQRSRGNKYNIRTIYSHNDIINIGKKLREIMETS